MESTLQKRCRIDALLLDPNRYTETLLSAAYDAGVYDADTVGGIQAALFDLLAARLEKMAGRDRCSVPAETAQALLSAVLYALDMRLLGESDPDCAASLLAGTSVFALYDEGIGRIRRRLRASELQYRKHLPLFHALPESVMKTTAIDGIAAFFRAYRPEGFSDAVPITADYPLYLGMQTLGGVRGVSFLAQYLQGLAIEASFLGKFRADTLDAVLTAADPLYRETPSNLFAPMLATALGMAMLNRPFSAWKHGLQGQDIGDILQHYDDGDLTAAVMGQAAEKVIDLLMLDAACAAYVRRAAEKLYESACEALGRRMPMTVFPCTEAVYRQAACRGGGSLFDDLGLRLSMRSADGVVYRGGRMQADRFRQLDFDLRSCETAEEKTEMILSRVQGLEDICDLLTADTGVLDAEAREQLLSALPSGVRLYLSEMVGEDLT